MNNGEKPRRFRALLPWLPAALTGLVAGFFLARVTFELWPARTTILATWPGAGGAAALVMLIALGLRWILARLTLTQYAIRGTFSLPFSLILFYTLWPDVNLLMAGALLAGAMGLCLALTLCALVPVERQWLVQLALPVILVLVVLAAYWRTAGQTVGSADTFEFQVVAPTLGIAHPTGYPLFILIGKLFSLIPIGSVAWRVNLVSAIFATVTIVLLYFLLTRLTGQRAVAALTALCLAFSRVFWSQAVEAEVYSLNAAFVTAILFLLAAGQDNILSDKRRWLCALAAICGLSLTHHLTMVILAPAIALSVWFARPRLRRWEWLLVGGCFCAPLLIELYVPLRWPALHNGAWMPLKDFLAWITGQQFGGAVQFGLWRDVTRWRIVSELMLQAFGPVGASLAALGWVWLVARQRRIAVMTLVAFAGYFSYGLIYNIPDISVFLIPAHVVMAMWIGIAAAQAMHWLSSWFNHSEQSERGVSLSHETEAPRRPCPTLYRRAGGPPGVAQGDKTWVRTLAYVAMVLLPLNLLWTNGPLVDQSNVGWELYRWGKQVLELPMPTQSAILADSEKIAPLYYLKRIENVRPDVETLVLGDEGLYRAELDRRVAAGQPVYLARYLPGLAGPYRLHSLGPLVRVTTKPMTSPPPMQKRLYNVNWGSGQVTLLGLDVESGQGEVAWRVTLYWQAQAKLDTNYHVRLRWVGPSGQVWWQDHGAHPVGGYNPTVAWQSGEIVADYHEIPADATIPPGLLRLDVGLFLPFRDEGLNRDGTTSPWFTLVLLDQVPSSPSISVARALRASFDELLITGASDPGVLPPDEPVSIMFKWSRIKSGPDRTLQLRWIDAKGTEARSTQVKPYAGEYPTSQWPTGHTLLSRVTIPAPSTPGAYTLRAGWLDAEGRALAARCAWLAPLTHDCAVGILRVEGTALGAERGINFDNQVLLLDAQIERAEMRANETLEIKLKWQGLRQWNADYTAFVHLIGPDGKLHGQVDQWPLDGTLATTDWSPGRVVDDPYHVPLRGDAPPGMYQVEVGWYLLATLRRLPVVDAQGRPVDDHVIIGTVAVQP